MEIFYLIMWVITSGAAGMFIGLWIRERRAKLAYRDKLAEKEAENIVLKKKDEAMAEFLRRKQSVLDEVAAARNKRKSNT